MGQKLKLYTESLATPAEASPQETGGFRMRFAEPDVLGAVLPRITASMNSSERAKLIVNALLHSGADLRKQPALEEMKRLFMKVMRFENRDATNNKSPLAI